MFPLCIKINCDEILEQISVISLKHRVLRQHFYGETLNHFHIPRGYKVSAETCLVYVHTDS